MPEQRPEENRPLTVLCVASYEKGQTFMSECKKQGCTVYLLTSQSLQNADWPRESLDEIFYMPDKNKEWNRHDVIAGVSFLARSHKIDILVPLDDFDVETGAAMREHLRMPGMGDTTARFFRDKLAMRVKAKEDGIPVPDFVHVLNYDDLRSFMKRVPAPWLIKPRSAASSFGIKKIHNEEEMWRTLDRLGDQQSFYVMERFVPGDIFHVDSIIKDKEVIFSIASKYGTPPFDIMHGGGIFTTRTMIYGSEDEQALQAINKLVMKSMRHVRGVSHTEFIKGNDGRFYFLETSARVGGANIVELVEASSGINLWSEWAKIEIHGSNYKLPKIEKNYAGLIVSLAKQEWPDLSSYNDPEIYWKMKRRYHAGIIIKSKDAMRIDNLINNYFTRFNQDYYTSAPMPENQGHL